MSSSKKAQSKAPAGSPRRGTKAPGSLKDLAVGSDRAGAGVKGGRKTVVKDSHDKYA